MHTHLPTMSISTHLSSRLLMRESHSLLLLYCGVHQSFWELGALYSAGCTWLNSRVDMKEHCLHLQYDHFSILAQDQIQNKSTVEAFEINWGAPAGTEENAWAHKGNKTRNIMVLMQSQLLSTNWKPAALMKRTWPLFKNPSEVCFM